MTSYLFREPVCDVIFFWGFYRRVLPVETKTHVRARTFQRVCNCFAGELASVRNRTHSLTDKKNEAHL